MDAALPAGVFVFRSQAELAFQRAEPFAIVAPRLSGHSSDVDIVAWYFCVSVWKRRETESVGRIEVFRTKASFASGVESALFLQIDSKIRTESGMNLHQT
ncbi:unnamed protein product [Leuciscus chuanchicus]